MNVFSREVKLSHQKVLASRGTLAKVFYNSPSSAMDKVGDVSPLLKEQYGKKPLLDP